MSFSFGTSSNFFIQQNLIPVFFRVHTFSDLSLTEVGFCVLQVSGFFKVEHDPRNFGWVWTLNLFKFYTWRLNGVLISAFSRIEIFPQNWMGHAVVLVDFKLLRQFQIFHLAAIRFLNLPDFLIFDPLFEFVCGKFEFPHQTSSNFLIFDTLIDFSVGSLSFTYQTSSNCLIFDPLLEFVCGKFVFPHQTSSNFLNFGIFDWVFCGKFDF